jgi:formylglycine-generating enzyme required for sulfatase activity
MAAFGGSSFRISPAEPSNLLLAEFPDKAYVWIFSQVEGVHFECNSYCQVIERGNGEFVLVVPPDYPQGLLLKAAGYQDTTVERMIPALPVKNSVRLRIEGEQLVAQGGEGNLRLQTIPAGAAISVKGLPLRGMKTPKTIEGLASGTWEVTLTKEQYRPEQFKVTVLSGKDVEKTIQLKQLWADLSVISEPPGASVVINGTPRGITPLHLSENGGLAEGKARVEIRLPHYKVVSKELSLVAGSNPEERFDLPPLWAGIQLESNPSGASVSIDGVFKGRTPLRLGEDDGLQGGAALLSVSLPRYRTDERTVSLVPGTSTALRCDLVPVWSGIEIRTDPEGASVLLGGVLRGHTPLVLGEGDGLSPGKTALELRLPGYQTERRELVLVAGANPSSSLQMKLLEGTLSINAEPKNCELVVDGAPQRKCSLSLALPLGEHVLEFSAIGYSTLTRTVRVEHSFQRVSINLEQRSQQISVGSTPLGAQVTWNGNLLGKTPIKMQAPLGYGVLQLSSQGYETYREPITWADGVLERDIALLQVRAVESNMSGQDQRSADPGEKPGMIAVKGGCFKMGSTDGPADERPLHEACVSSFRMDESEVTQGEYFRIVGKNPSSFSGCGANCPVDGVNWVQASSYCEKLGKRLPTEAEWEYAARGGSKSQNFQFSGSNDPDLVAWSEGNSDIGPRQACNKLRNELGLCDMSGNVWEWVSDRYGSSYAVGSRKQDPQGAPSGAYRVARGGAWDYDISQTTIAFRERYSPDTESSDLGFRCVSQ